MTLSIHEHRTQLAIALEVHEDARLLMGLSASPWADAERLMREAQAEAEAEASRWADAACASETGV